MLLDKILLCLHSQIICLPFHSVLIVCFALPLDMRVDCTSAGRHGSGLSPSSCVGNPFPLYRCNFEVNLEF